MEYIITEVKPEQIRRVIIPEVFKDRISVPDDDRIVWCALVADEINNNGNYVTISDERLKVFAKTTVLDFTDFNNHGWY